MNTSQRKRLALYDRFSQNLGHIKNALKISFQDDNGGYICPLSLKIFSKDGVQDIYEDQLTLEHAPPKSLGGKIVALTAKDLNSQSGHSLDIKLMDYIVTKEFKNGTMPLPTKFKVNNEISIEGGISKTVPNFSFKVSSMHYGAKKFLKLLESNETFKMDFSIKKITRPDIGLLRTAYLIAFSHTGYSLLFSRNREIDQNMHKIREQILNPNKAVISDSIPIIEENFPNPCLGVNIVHSPKELRSILVVFDLTLSSTYRFGVFLPGPDNYAFAPYKNFRSYNDSVISFKMDNISNNVDLQSYRDSVLLWKKWEELNGWTN